MHLSSHRAISYNAVHAHFLRCFGLVREHSGASDVAMLLWQTAGNRSQNRRIVGWGRRRRSRVPAIFVGIDRREPARLPAVLHCLCDSETFAASPDPP